MSDIDPAVVLAALVLRDGSAFGDPDDDALCDQVSAEEYEAASRRVLRTTRTEDGSVLFEVAGRGTGR